MNLSAPPVTSFSDTRGLQSLRASAAAGDPQAAREVAIQFEALMIGEMLKSARQAGFGDSYFDSNSTQTYRELFDQQIAMDLARRGGIGFADMIADNIKAAPSSLPWRPESAEEFTAVIWPHAEEVGGRLGVDPALIVAQAAHETGWGRAMLEFPDARPAFNLFGVKAGTSWDGARVRHSTLEYRDGSAERRVETFRAYASIEDGFADYGRLLSQPRYAQVRGVGNDAAAFAAGLAAGGYATDPDYAEKLLAVANGGRLNSLVAHLKDPGHRSTRAVTP